jgi:YVTN family beta-propeller protein
MSQYQVFFGAPPASASSQLGTNLSVQPSNFLTVTAPPGTSQGVSSLTVVRSDGWYEVAPDAVSYGPQILSVNANAGPSAGGSQIVITGFGLDQNTQVTIGDKSAIVSNATGTGAFAMVNLLVTTPPGIPGLADVTVTTATGAATLTGGFQYLAEIQVYPVDGALQPIAYDQARQLLYISNADHNRVEVFSLAAQTFLTPITVGTGPTGIALSTDTAKLAVANSGDGTVSVIDPTTRTVITTFPVLTAQDTNSMGCGGVPASLWTVTQQRVIVGVFCKAASGPYSYTGLAHLVDLNSGSLSCRGIAGCGADGTSISIDPLLISSSPDGTKVAFGSNLGFGFGVLDLSANVSTSTQREGGESQPAILDDGTLNIAVTTLAPSGQLAFLGTFDQSLREISYISDADYLQTAGVAAFNNLSGPRFNSSGSLLYQPQQKTSGTASPTLGVDIFDVHTGRLAMRVALPDPLVGTPSGPLNLDQTGANLFLISSTGITIAQLSEVPLSIAKAVPSLGSPGTQVTIQGSGFTNGATVTFGTAASTVNFVNQNTLQATIPSLPSGSVRVTVTNPDGQDYSFDNLFTVQ